jgi:O-antigen/teichoic acid export membrane protein
MWYLAASVVAAALAALSVTIALGWPLAALRRARKDLRDGAYFSASLAATTIYTDIDKVMLAQLATLAAAGVYSAAYRVIGLAFLPVASLLLAAYPRFFKHGTAGIESSSRYAKRLLTVSLPLGFGAGLVVFVGAPLIPRVLGNEFASAVSIVRWLAVVPALQAAYYLGADALTGANLQRARTAIQVGTAGANVGLNLWLIPAYGARGAAWSTIASYAFLAIAVWIAVAAATQRSRERRRAPDARPGLARG